MWTTLQLNVDSNIRLDLRCDLSTFEVSYKNVLYKSTVIIKDLRLAWDLTLETYDHLLSEVGDSQK